jgi:hypothetical protein
VVVKMFFVDGNAGFDCLTHETVINSLNFFVSDCLIDIDVTFDLEGNYILTEVFSDYKSIVEVD